MCSHGAVQAALCRDALGESREALDQLDMF